MCILIRDTWLRCLKRRNALARIIIAEQFRSSVSRDISFARELRVNFSGDRSTSHRIENVLACLSPFSLSLSLPPRKEVNSTSSWRRNRRKTTRRTKTRKHSLTSSRVVFNVRPSERGFRADVANTRSLVLYVQNTLLSLDEFLVGRDLQLQRDYSRERNAENVCSRNSRR